MTEKEVKKEFENFLKAPKIKLKEEPKLGDSIIQIFLYKKETSILLNTSLTEKQDKKYIEQPFPLAVVLAAHPGDEYKEGDVIYLTDKILLTQINPKWLIWADKLENQTTDVKSAPFEEEPSKYIGGLNELDQYRFKRNKLTTEDEPIDNLLFQIPNRIIRGKYK